MKAWIPRLYGAVVTGNEGERGGRGRERMEKEEGEGGCRLVGGKRRKVLKRMEEEKRGRRKS